MSVKSQSIAARTSLIRTYYPLTNNLLNDTKDIILRFLRHYFSQMSTGDFQFLADGGLFTTGISEIPTEIIITDSGTIGTDTVEKRPAIIVSRTPFSYANLGLDNLVSHTFSTDKRTHTDMMTGNFTINCISRIGLEAETLAMSVAKAFKFYRRQLQQYGFFQIGQRITVGAESPANSFLGGDSDEDFINVPVTFPVYYQETWSITPQDSETLSSISVTINSIARKVNGSLVYPDSFLESGAVNPNSDGVIVLDWNITTS